LKTPYLLGIITVLLFGSFAVSGMIAQAGPLPIETIAIAGPLAIADVATAATSTAECPNTHPFLIGGSYHLNVPADIAHAVTPFFDVATNSFTVAAISGAGDPLRIQATALCANFNFPMNMGMIGGELLDLDTMALFVGAIGVNPVITGLVAITMGGLAVQAVWFVHRRRKSKNS